VIADLLFDHRDLGVELVGFEKGEKGLLVGLDAAEQFAVENVGAGVVRLIEQIGAVGLHELVNSAVEIVLAVEFGVCGDLLVNFGFFFRNIEQAVAGQVGAVREAEAAKQEEAGGRKVSEAWHGLEQVMELQDDLANKKAFRRVNQCHYFNGAGSGSAAWPHAAP